MPSNWKIAVAAVMGVALAWFVIACIRAVRKSRRLMTQYRSASAEERAVLDARIQSENELGAYMLPLPLLQVVSAFVLVALMVVLAFLRVLK